jgi:polyphosphate kinase 2 (PPK2 family)
MCCTSGWTHATLSTHGFSTAPTDEERARPVYVAFLACAAAQRPNRDFCRFVVFAARLLNEFNNSVLSKGDLDQRMDQINRFEAMLVNEGALVLKFWFHLSKDGQRQRLKDHRKRPENQPGA